jgi:cholesterol oxidase
VPPGADLTYGIAITSSFHPDTDTHIENVRYGKGSNAMGLLGSVLVDGGGRSPRWLRWLGQVARRPDRLARTLWVRRWSQRTVIGLVMQSLDNSLTVSARPRRFGGGFTLTSRQGHGEPNPTWIPVGHQAIRRLAALLQARTGVPADAGGTIGDAADIPMTAHFLGGCVIGDGPQRGVVDAYHRVHGYPGLHIVDGSAVSANLGVNPSLTITAQAERAMSLWPNRSDPDPRPAPGAAYVRLDAVPPVNPAVPDDAPGALRLAPVPR